MLFHRLTMCLLTKSISSASKLGFAISQSRTRDARLLETTLADSNLFINNDVMQQFERLGGTAVRIKVAGFGVALAGVVKMIEPEVCPEHSGDDYGWWRV